LDDLVIGLLKGLGKRFQVDVTVEQRACKGDGAPHSVFYVTWS
jgi:hypothetical protein